MKKIVYLIVFILSANIYSQENKLKVRSFSSSFGGIIPFSNTNQNTNEESFIYISLDGTLSIKKHLISLSFNRGFNFVNILFNSKKNVNTQVDLLYGREYKLIKDWFKIELYSGIGYFNNSNYDVSWSVALPIKSKFLFYPTEKIGLGLSANASINKISSLASFTLTFQYNL